MYGLIVENWTQYITATYGEEKWEEIRRMANIEHTTFNTHSVYSDNYIPRLTARACQILNVSEKELLNGMGKFFVSYIGQYGYDRVLSVLGRNMRDFLNGLDNLHEYLKFSYPRMKAPSFFCENETPTGLILHYRSTRRGFLWYTVGQIREVGSHFYNTEVKIEVIKEETVFDSQHVMFQLTFDNRAFQLDQSKMVQKIEKFMLPIKAQIFLEIFPFCIVFDQNMAIKTIGNSLRTILPAIVNQKLLKIFDITRPLIECTWRAILSHTNNIFELTTVEPVFKVDNKLKKRGENISASSSSENWGHNLEEEEEDSGGNAFEDKLLHLKGQMMFMEEWHCMVYLGTPVMRDLDAMIHTGLYINDLSMHDFSRDMVLAGQQQSAELKLALDQELLKSRQLEDSMRKLDIEMKRTDELLYQMIPKQVADRLRKGEPAVDTCQFFDSVTILFSDVVTFTEICSRITPMQVVSLLNSMYSLFDQLTEKHGVYKVETIGDAYMVVSGAPEKVDHHAEKICQMALDMIEVIGGLKDPSTDQSIKIRVGVHSGAVVAGVVGLKMPRYCLFGDAVNCASRMESTSEALKIHISEKTKELLVPGDWDIIERGKTTVKGKGQMKTFWLLSRTNKEFSMAQQIEHQQSEIHIREPIAIITRSTAPPPRFSGVGNSVRLKSPSPETFEEVTRFTPVSSTPISVTSTYNDPAITYTEPLNETSKMQGQIKVTDTTTAPAPNVDRIVTKVGNNYVCQTRTCSQGSRTSCPMNIGDKGNYSSCHGQATQATSSSRNSINRCCNHCHFGGQMKQLSDLVSQHQSILKENSFRTPGTLVPYVPHQAIECCPRNHNHDHYRSQTCVLI